MRIFTFLLIVSAIFASGCTVVINPEAKMVVTHNDVIIYPWQGDFDFGTTYVGENNNEATFMITNKGKKTLELIDLPKYVMLSGTDKRDFSLDTLFMKGKISSNKSTTFSITFRPSSVGVKKAIISILSNDEKNRYYLLHLIGNAVTPEISVKQENTSIVSGSSTYDFNEEYLGYSSKEVLFTIYNTGSGDLSLTGSPNRISISGSNASEFVIDQSMIDESLAPGSSTSFSIKVDPQSIGAKAATISIANNDLDEDPFEFAVKAVVIDPGIVILDSSQNAIVNGSGVFDFGDVLKYETSQETFTIKNLGSSNLLLNGNPTLSGSGASKFYITSQPASNILPGGSTTFNVVFNSTNSSEFTASISIQNNDPIDNPYVFTIRGRGVEPEIKIKDFMFFNIHSGSTTVNIGDVFVGNSASETFTIYNDGTYNLNLDGSPKVALSGAGISVYSVTTQPSSPIAPGGNTTFTIEFKPTDIVEYIATVSISNNDFDENPFTFTLWGIGKKPEINVKQGSTNIPSGSGTYDFGNGYIGYPGQSVVFTIENLGNINLSLTSTGDLVTKSGSDATMFSVNLTSTTTPITPGNSTTFSITFTPTSTGNKTATISIENDDADENPYTFTVKGTGIAPAPEINVKHGSTNIPNSTGIYQFGAIIIGSSNQPITFTIENLGVINLNLNGSYVVELSGTDASEFVLDTTATTTPVAPAGITTFIVTFSPTSEGNKTATITIANDDPDENPYTFEISGIGFLLDYGWTRIFGGNENDRGYCITTDSMGNIYVAGSTFGYVDFGTDFGVSDIKSPIGDADIFVTKINSNGTYGWTRRIGGYDSDNANDIATDSSGNVYVTGYFKATVDFGADFGVSDSKTSSGAQDVYVTKINANGTYGWTKIFGGSEGGDYGNSITIDAAGNIYITGNFYGHVNFAADFGSTNNKSANSTDIFVTKINSNVTYGWTKKFGSSYGDKGYSVKTDSSGNVFVTGYFCGITNFGADFGISDSKTSAGSGDIFLMKINANGTYGWTKRMGGNGSDCGNSISLDTYGNIYITGEFVGTVDFGSDFGVSDSKTSVGEEDVFITRINANGTYGWTRRIGGTSGYDTGSSIATDASGNIFVIGEFNGTVDFGSDFGTSENKTAAGRRDVYVTKLDSSGSYGWTRIFGCNSNYDHGRSIASDNAGNIYISGDFEDTVNFGADFGVSDSKTSAGKSDIFVTKIILN